MGPIDAKIEHARALLNQGRLDQALAAAQRLVVSSAHEPRAALVMSEVCRAMGRGVQAAHFASQAITLAPRLPAAHAALAAAYMDAREFTRAEHAARIGLEHTPEDAGLGSLRAAALLNLARAGEAAGTMHDLCERYPDHAELASGLALVLNYVPGVEPAVVFAAHRRYGDILDRTVSRPAVTLPNTREPDRRLRVGLLSPDLRRHSVAAFIEPLLRHAPADIELVVFHTNAIADDATARLRALAPAWHALGTATNEQVAQAIFNERIDVLVELSGHTHGHALPALHLRPAPVQVTYLGYPNTTGVGTIARRVCDAWTDPSPGGDALATERLLRLAPCFLCYQPPQDADGTAPPGPSSPRPFTFGSFNSAQKINGPLIEVWAALLVAVPESRLALKAVNFADAELRGDVRSRFEAAGVAPERLDLLPPLADPAAHRAAYAGIDAALDPFPYNGTTTTCEALWMGVPVVTLAGGVHAVRVGASLLNAVGLPELVATTPEDYVRVAAGLAAAGPRDAAARAALRERVRRSPLCDGPAFARTFADALRAAWREWCEKP